jgi:exodeoxyribonuclease V gamma subunit
MRLYTSNRLEQLANQLSAVLAKPLDSTLAGEIIVVQSRGMARWLSLQIAGRSNICMNCEFPFPRTFIGRILRVYFPGMASEEAFNVETMTWKISHLLADLTLEKEFAPVKNYLEGGDELKTFQLSEKIARLFDQYLVYRPEILMEWELDADQNDWQALLWKSLAGKGEPLHLARMHASLNAIVASPPPESGLPQRVSIFGLSSLPPFYLQVFIELSRHCQVNLFLLDPSQEYYGLDLSPKMKARLLRKIADRGLILSADDLPTGNPLLTSLGKLNRDFTEVRLELDERAGFVIEEQPGQFVEPDGKGMLHTLQRDILHSRNRGDRDNPKEEVTTDDGSIQIHACHSPMREIEVLYDHLLERFEQDHTLKPRDILVMTPDIEKYGPFIQTVFGYPEHSQRYIPFSVADRRPSNTSPNIETLLALLALPDGRCTASEIFSLLERMPIRRRFAFTDEDMTMIRQWISKSGIRWGMDAAHRKVLQLPELDANTWRIGFRRCLLGYAMAGHNHTIFEGLMPYDEVEGGSAEVLGRFISAVEALFRLMSELPAVRPLSEWPKALGAVIDQFFLGDTDEEIADLGVIRMALDHFRRSALTAGDQKVEFCVARYHLQQLLDQGEQRGGFLTGAVTFCAFQPMRSIPARLICLVGMGDQDFPRPSSSLGFDLMAIDRKCGDRSTRNDDKSIFLEALNSARERLYLSYVGRSAIDNQEVPPSVLVSELLDYLDQAFLFPNRKKARDWLVSEHPLHAFSPRYFDGKGHRLFSYSEANAAASRSLSGSSRQPDFDFFADPLPAPSEEARRVELKSLIEFFDHPAKYFIRRRIRLCLDQKNDLLEDNEPFALDFLQLYSLQQELVTDALENRAVTVDNFATRGVIPMGEVGIANFQRLLSIAQDFGKKLQPALLNQAPDQPLLIDLRIGPFSLTGRIDSLYGGQILRFRCATLKPKDKIRAWINHLVLCAVASNPPRETVLIGTDKIFRFSPVEKAQDILADLLDTYWRGLSRALPFFPESALAYAEAQLSTSNRSTSLPIQKALAAYRSKDWSEGNDSYNVFCFPGGDPLDNEFTNLALEVFEPLLRNATIVP